MSRPTDAHAGDLLDVDGELIGAWEVSHGTDEWTRLYEQYPPGMADEVIYTFYEDNSVKIESNNRSYWNEWQFDEEEKELKIYHEDRDPEDVESFGVSFSLTGERMSWEHPDLPVYLVLESVD